MSGNSTPFRPIWLGTLVLLLLFSVSVPYSSPEPRQALAQAAESTEEAAADGPESSDTEARLREAEQRADAVLADPSEYGFQGGLGKPFELPELISAVTLALRSGPEPEAGDRPPEDSG